MRDDSQPATLDDPNELFDLVDERDQVIGTVRRGQAHGDPRLIHRSVQVLVFDRHGRLFLQKRSLRKDLFAGYLCASASGHVTAGENYAATARREVQEELGVTLDGLHLDTTLVRSPAETEITAIFLAHADGPFTCHPSETDGGLFVTPRDLADGIAAGTLSLTPTARAAIASVLAHGAWPEALPVASRLARALTD